MPRRKTRTADAIVSLARRASTIVVRVNALGIVARKATFASRIHTDARRISTAQGIRHHRRIRLLPLHVSAKWRSATRYGKYARIYMYSI